MCMYEFMCLPMCVYCVSHVCTCTHAHAYRHAHTHAHTCTHMHTCVHTCTHTRVTCAHPFNFPYDYTYKGTKDTMIWDIKTVLQFSTIV